MPRGWPVLVLFIAVSLLAGAIGGLATASSVETWYATLDKPSWNPPNAVFGPVWTALYILMGLAAWMVWCRRETAPIRTAMTLFAVQLALNSIWSILFFGLHRPGLAALEILALWIAIAGTIVAFSRVSAVAAGLLVPYLAWVSFATALNLAIWRLNP